MKKSLLALMLAIALVSLTACGSKVKEPEATATPIVTEAPTAEPTEAPTAEPTEAPTAVPTEAPTAEPTEAPTAVPTEAPTAEPTEAPTAVPTEAPTAVPTAEPTEAPAATEEPAAEEAALTLSDDVLASAYNGAVTVLKSEIQDEYDQMLSQYVAYYAQYGYSVDEYDTELQASVAQETVQTKLSTSIVRHYAAQNGYELTEEKKTELAAQVKTALDNTREYLESYLSAYGFTGDELNAAVEEQMAQAGYTEETLMDSAELNDVLNFLYERATADVTVTEDEVKAAFDEKVAKQKESYASVDSFINDYVNESEILYTPENVRLMECIFVASVEGEATEDEATADEATVSEATVAEATAGEAADIASLTGYAKAKAIAAAIAGGADFEESMKAYNEDSSTEEQMLRGYPVAENSTTYGDEFTAGAMALEHVGDVSDVIVTDYGYFILRYAKDLESGEADFEARKETETEETLTNKKNDAYSAFIDTILDEADIQVGDLSQMYHVYVGEAVEATVAYASVNADTKLLDMPGGDAVADMKAGASVDILGSIDADGKTYSFVAVPGTEIKGYVGADMLDETEYWRAYVENHIPAAYPGIKEIMTRHKAEGGLICVVSHSFARNIYRDYEANGLPVPDAVYGWERPAEERKPSPFPLEDIMRRFSLTPDELLMIDDLKPGYDMAAKCSVAFAAVGWSSDIPQIEHFMRANCPNYFKTVAQLDEFLK